MLSCAAMIGETIIPLERQPLFLGYKPLVMGIWDSPEKIQPIADAKTVRLVYRNKVTGVKVATLELTVDQLVAIENQQLILLKGISGVHQLETFGERMGFRINEWLSKKSPGNISLTPGEYDQLKIAYSVPREIRMLTVCCQKGCNTFPIDLFGPAGENHLVLSLRHVKESCRQLEQAENMATRIVPARYAPFAYLLGKNHSQKWHKAVVPPEIALEEFELVRSIGDFGVHRLFLLRRKSAAVADSPERLMHAHISYVNWHKRQGFPLKEIAR
jgi:hypothetical protein